MPRVGVQRFVEVLGLLGELVCGTQIQILASGCPIRASAVLAGQAIGGVSAANDGSAALRAADERNQSVGDHRCEASTLGEERLEPFGAPVPTVLRDGCKRRIGEPATEVRVAGEPPDAGGKRIRIPRSDEERRPLVGQHFAYGRQVRGDDCLAGRHVFEQLERRGRVRGDCRCRIGECQDVRLPERAGDRRRRQQSPERHAAFDAESCRERPQPGKIWFLLVAPDDKASHVGQPCDRVEQHIDALPRVEVAGIGDSKRCQGARVTGARRHEPRAVGYDRNSRPAAEPCIVG